MGRFARFARPLRASRATRSCVCTVHNVYTTPRNFTYNIKSKQLHSEIKLQCWCIYKKYQRLKIDWIRAWRHVRLALLGKESCFHCCFILHSINKLYRVMCLFSLCVSFMIAKIEQYTCHLHTL